MDQAFDGCKGAIPIADDIQVYGNENTHDTHLHEAMEKARSAGIKLNYDKCVIKTKSCTENIINILLKHSKLTEKGISPSGIRTRRLSFAGRAPYR